MNNWSTLTSIDLYWLPMGSIMQFWSVVICIDQQWALIKWSLVEAYSDRHITALNKWLLVVMSKHVIGDVLPSIPEWTGDKLQAAWQPTCYISKTTFIWPEIASIKIEMSLHVRMWLDKIPWTFRSIEFSRLTSASLLTNYEHSDPLNYLPLDLPFFFCVCPA